MPMSDDCQPGSGDQAEQQADDDARQRDHVGQQMMLEIDGEQHDQRAAEDQPRDAAGSDGP